MRTNEPGECHDDISADRRELSARLDSLRRAADPRLRGRRPAADRIGQHRGDERTAYRAQGAGGGDRVAGRRQGRGGCPSRAPFSARTDGKSVVEGKSVSVRGDPGGRRIIKKK